jgi:uncharacterized membrane protein YkoI
MKTKHMAGIALGVVTLGAGLLGAGYAASGAGKQDPAYTSSIQTKDDDREKKGEHRGERGEALRLAPLTKIDSTQATSAAVSQVPGTVLSAALENENGNVVYSVVIKTPANEIKDVKVDAGNAAVLHVGPGGSEHEEDD